MGQAGGEGSYYRAYYIAGVSFGRCGGGGEGDVLRRRISPKPKPSSCREVSSTRNTTVNQQNPKP